MIENYIKLNETKSYDEKYHLRIHVLKDETENLCLGIYRNSYSIMIFYPYRMTKKELAIMRSILNIYGFHDLNIK